LGASLLAVLLVLASRTGGRQLE